MNANGKNVLDAWLTAAGDLGFDVIVPFALNADGRDYENLVLVPHFGGGILVAGLSTDRGLRLDAKDAGYQCSFVNAERYGRYDRDFFVDTLSEWGFTGPEHKRPTWLKDPSAL